MDGDGLGIRCQHDERVPPCRTSCAEILLASGRAAPDRESSPAPQRCSDVEMLPRVSAVAIASSALVGRQVLATSIPDPRSSPSYLLLSSMASIDGTSPGTHRRCKRRSCRPGHRGLLLLSAGSRAHLAALPPETLQKEELSARASWTAAAVGCRTWRRHSCRAIGTVGSCRRTSIRQHLSKVGSRPSCLNSTDVFTPTETPSAPHLG